MMLPLHNIDTFPVKYCMIVFSSSLAPRPDYYWTKGHTDVWGHQLICTSKRKAACPCIFSIEPSFNVRGLCKDAVMDTNYKLADHKSMDKDLIEDGGKMDDEDTRSYVGPKGWVISRHGNDRIWRMEHQSYPELSLTMLDMDALPIGRHNWKINNNVCNQGITNVQSLLFSSCKEEQFTCDDGKCLEITQRCNNIEAIVFFINVFFINIKKFFKDCDDVSDEKNCQIIAIDEEKYLRSKPPPSDSMDTKLPVTLR